MSKSKQRPKIAVIFNSFIPMPGRNAESASERAVEQAAREAAEALGIEFDATLVPVDNNLNKLARNVTSRRFEAFINLCEGFGGNPAFEAHVAALMEIAGIPFTGNTARTIMICQDKFRSKTLLQAAGIQTPAGWPAKNETDVPRSVKFPLIVKPIAEDASIGIRADSVVTNRAQMAVRIKSVVRHYHQPALIERFIDGREFNVGIIDGPKGPRVLPISEIPFKGFPQDQPHIVGYEAKWMPNHALYRLTTPVCPACVSPQLERLLKTMAMRAWHELGLRGYGRVDFRVDRQGRAYVLEVNPNPDTSKDAGLARALSKAGIAYSDFWQQQVELSLKYWRESRLQ